MSMPTIALRGGDKRTANGALVDSTVIKASEGKLYTLTVHNTGAGAAYLMLFDLAAVPADTAVPPFCFKVGADESVQLHWGDSGRQFAAGIVAVMSSTDASLTKAAAESYIDAVYS